MLQLLLQKQREKRQHPKKQVKKRQRTADPQPVKLKKAAAAKKETPGEQPTVSKQPAAKKTAAAKKLKVSDEPVVEKKPTAKKAASSKKQTPLVADKF